MLKSDIKQRQVVQFYKSLRELQGEGKLSQPEYNDCVLKSAVKAGMLENISKPEQVDELDPREVNKQAEEVAQFLVDMLKVDPN